MYYDVLMKNTCFVLGFCLCAGWTWAQSTCETRVDAHQKASTVQRVHYCLNGEQADPSVTNPAMVFSGVSSPKQQPAVQPTKQPDEALARPGAFKPKRFQVSKEFVPTRQFPKLDDGRASQQEIYAKQKALRDGKEMAQEAVAQSDCAMPEHEVETVRRPVLRQMTDAPRLNATRKPARTTYRAHKKMVTKPVVETAQAQTADTTSTFEGVLNAPAPQGKPADVVSYAPVEMTYEEYAPVEATQTPAETATQSPAN